MSKDIVVIAHNIRSLWNIGAVFRSADAFNVSHIHLTGYTATPPRKEIGKTALGAEATVPWSQENDPINVITQRKNEGYTIVSLELKEGSTPLMDFRPEKPVCIILGHEILGVPPELMKLSDATVQIPMLGTKNSLNVSVAAGIAFYHFRCCC
ncbi:MAG: RNA methyltransferase [Candidatus Peribacteraceae bacterium]|nr:RNA methyltransferase [Candidatus Peribacteraceae bacterium]